MNRLVNQFILTDVTYLSSTVTSFWHKFHGHVILAKAEIQKLTLSRHFGESRNPEIDVVVTHHPWWIRSRE